MNWFLVVYFLVNDVWIEADTLEKEGWSAIQQPSFSICIEKMNETNERFIKIAEFKNIELDIKFECECRKNIEKPNTINCKERHWLQKFWDKLITL